MFPYRSDVRTRYPPVLVWCLIGVNVLIFLYQASLPPALAERFLVAYALIPSRYFGELAAFYPPSEPGDYLPFASNMFLHGGLLHLIFNMWSLLVFGPAVEDRLGVGRFLAFYLTWGIAASLAHALFNPFSTAPALGASGAIAGIIGCHARLFPLARLGMFIPILFIPVFVEVPALGFAMMWFILQLIPGLVSLGAPGDMGGVAWWAHIGGFLAGWLMAPVIRLQGRAYRAGYADEDAPADEPGRRRRGPWD
jgi:membrane associated rhomboid family serine protease